MTRRHHSPALSLSRRTVARIVAALCLVFVLAACGSDDGADLTTAASATAAGATDTSAEQQDQSTEDGAPTTEETVAATNENPTAVPLDAADEATSAFEPTDEQADAQGETVNATQAEPTASTEDTALETVAPTTLPSCAFNGVAAYKVVNIAADDPDGGLIMHEGPALDSPDIGVLPAGTVDIAALDCRVGPRDINWISVDTRDFGQGWVSAAYLDQMYVGGPGDTIVVDQLIGLQVYGTETNTLRTAFADALGLDRDDVRVGQFEGIDAQGGGVEFEWDVRDDSISVFEGWAILSTVRDDAGNPTGQVEVTQATANPICSRGVVDGLCL